MAAKGFLGAYNNSPGEQTADDQGRPNSPKEVLVAKKSSDSKRHKKNKLLYAMARLLLTSIRAGGHLDSGADWLLIELQKLDKKAYDKQVTTKCPAGIDLHQRIAKVPVAELQNLVGHIIDTLYLDRDGEHFSNADFYNPDKEWNTDTACAIAELLKGLHLVPLKAQKA